MMRGNSLTGAAPDGRGQEEGKKATSEIGDILYSSSSSGKKAHPAYSEDLRRVFHPHQKWFNSFLFPLNGHSFIGHVIILHQARPPLMPNVSSHGFFPALMKMSFVCPCPCCLPDSSPFTRRTLRFYNTNSNKGKID